MSAVSSDGDPARLAADVLREGEVDGYIRLIAVCWISRSPTNHALVWEGFRGWNGDGAKVSRTRGPDRHMDYRSDGSRVVGPPRVSNCHLRSGEDEPGPSGQPVAQIRGILAERVVMSTPLDPFLDLRALTTYSGLSRRKLRNYLTDAAHPLPCYRIGGKILVRRSEYDAWAACYRQVGQPAVDRIVTDVLKSL